VKLRIRVLAVAILVAVILATGASPAGARRISGGVLLATDTPCYASANSHNGPGTDLLIDPPGRAPGCWVLLPPSATQQH
jgi:hypothetical protein